MAAYLRGALVSAAVTSAILLSAPPLRADPAAFAEILRLDKELRHHRALIAQEQREERARTRRVQSALKSLGYYGGRIDGNFGPQTEEALAAYQEERGFYPTLSITDYDVEQMEAEVNTAPPGVSALEPGAPVTVD